MFKCIKSVSAPIIINEDFDNKNITIVKKTNNMPNPPREIIEYNLTAPNLFVSPFLVHELMDFKTRNAMINDSLKDNPTIEFVIHEYKVSYRRKLRSQFNKLTVNNVMDTVKFINDNTNNILTNNEMTDFIIERIKNDLWEKMKMPIITAYVILIQELENILEYHFTFSFDKEFLSEYFNNEEKYYMFPDMINNLTNFIILLYENKLIGEDEIYEFFDSYILKPEVPYGMEYSSFCKSIINIIHGMPNGNPKFKPNSLFNIFKKYLKEREDDIVSVYQELSNKNKSSFLSKMMIEMIDNIKNDRICCKHCEMMMSV